MLSTSVFRLAARSSSHRHTTIQEQYTVSSNPTSVAPLDDLYPLEPVSSRASTATFVTSKSDFGPVPDYSENDTKSVLPPESATNTNAFNDTDTDNNNNNNNNDTDLVVKKQRAPSPSPPPPPYSPPVTNFYSMSVQASSVLTQVAPEAGIQQPYPNQAGYDLAPQPDIAIKLYARGSMFDMTRNELMKLPESILLSLFPNGVFVDVHGNVIQTLSEQDVVAINFSPDCLKYTLDLFRSAEADYLSRVDPAEAAAHQWNPALEDGASVEMLRTKPAIVVLREDLDYFCLPPSRDTTEAEMRDLKVACGAQLVQRDHIFSGLKRGNESGTAEQHLVEMLCNSGFTLNDTWGYRSTEPGRAVIGSLALVQLRSSGAPVTAEPVAAAADAADAADAAADADLHAAGDINAEPSAEDDFESTRHKLLLFWRKPARKCWWDSVKLEGIPGYDEPITVHIRRVWTLELSVIGI